MVCTNICVGILGFLIPILVAVNMFMDSKEEPAEIPVYKVSIDQMISVINRLMMTVRLTPHEKTTLYQLIKLLESRKEELDEEE